MHYFGGWILFQDGQKDKARHWLQRYLQHSPQGPFAGKAKGLLDEVRLSVPEGMILIP